MTTNLIISLVALSPNICIPPMMLAMSSGSPPMADHFRRIGTSIGADILGVIGGADILDDIVGGSVERIVVVFDGVRYLKSEEICVR